MVGSLHRRHPHPGRVQTEGTRTKRSTDVSSRMLGLYNKFKEVSTDTSTDNRFSGPHSRHCTNATKTSRGKTKKDLCRSTEPAKRGSSLSQGPLQTDREDERHLSGYSPSPTVLSSSTDDSYTGSGTELPELRHLHTPLQGMQGGAEVVGRPHVQVEWENPNKERDRYDHRIRCIPDRLLPILSGTEDWRPLDITRSSDAYKLPGATGCDICSPDICKGKIRSYGATEVGQHISSSLHQQPGRHNIVKSSSSSQNPVDMVFGTEHTHHSPTPSRDVESCSRHRVSDNAGPYGLETQPSFVQKDRSPTGANTGGPVRIQDYQTVPSLLQLAARSLCSSNRCIPPGLVPQQGLCEPTMVSDRQSPITGSSPAGPGDTSGTSLEDAAMVSSVTRDVGRLPTGDRPELSHSNEYGSTYTDSSIGRMAYLREKYRRERLSEEATTLLLKSRRVKTNKSYDSLFSKWNSWCSGRGSDPFSGPVSEVVNFLAQLFAEGCKYNSLNCYRSAISSVHERVDGYDVGQHPLVARLLKGAFNDRPPLPRYSSTWEVQVVLDYLQSLGLNESLSLKHVTWKTVMLLALTRPSRSVDLSNLDLKMRSFRSEGVEFASTGLAKQTRQGRTIANFFFPSCPDKPELCPVQALRAYESQTEMLRGEESKLFVAVIRPHKAVTSSTIARWLKFILGAAGVDTSIFNAHTVRGASASRAANMGITTNDILKTANWSSESVFQRFYHKPTEMSKYGRAVLSKLTGK